MARDSRLPELLEVEVVAEQSRKMVEACGGDGDGDDGGGDGEVEQKRLAGGYRWRLYKLTQTLRAAWEGCHRLVCADDDDDWIRVC